MEKKNVPAVIGILIYRILLDVCYFFAVSPLYAYAGFGDFHKPTTIIVSWMLIVVCIPSVSKMLQKHSYVRISDIVLMILVCTTYIPFTTLVAAGVYDPYFIILQFIYFIVLFKAQDISNKKDMHKVVLKMGSLHMNKLMLQVFALFSAMLVLFISIRYTGFRINFNLELVYDLRADAKSFNMPTIINYAFAWTSLLNGVSMVYAIINQKYGLAAAFFGIQMVSFGIDGAKFKFFQSFLLLAVAIFFHDGMTRLFKTAVPWLLAAVSLVCFLFYSISENILPMSLFIRRFLFLPAYINSCYVDFFRYHTPDYFRGSFLRHLGIQTPYPQLPHIIGGIYFHAPESNCNGGMISDAITNWGIPGVIIMPLLIVAFLRFMDGCARDVDSRVVLSIALNIAITLMSTFFTSALLTNGLWLAAVCLMLMQKKRDSIATFGGTTGFERLRD